MTRSIAIIIQARMGSTRLPGKVLMEVAGKTILWHMIKRLSYCRAVDTIVLATTTLGQDDALAEFALKNNITCVRGSEKDVLSRHYEAGLASGADTLVRLPSDKPLVEPAVVDMVVREHLDSGADYTSNWLKPTFPIGIEVEVMKFDALEKAHREAQASYQREHVTPYLYENPALFKTHSVEAQGKLRRPDIRLTIDTPEDLDLIRKIYSGLYRENGIFHIEQVIDFLDANPGLTGINSHVKQKGLTG